MKIQNYSVFAPIFIAVTAALISCSPGNDRPSGLRISGNGRYFTDAKRQPVFWQGDTEWELFHLMSVSEAGALLKERSRQGFNVVQVMAAGVFPEWGVMTGMKPWPDQQAWLDKNPQHPNEEYFKRADSIVAAAQECGITLVIGVYHAKDVEGGRITAENAGPWAEWLARRYREAPNVIWSMYPHADSASIPIIRATVRGIRAGDGGRHLITMHPDPSPKSSSFMHAEPWLSFNTLQTWSTGPLNRDMVAADYSREPAKPVVNGEARYEAEDGTTPLETRRAGYWACLAGGFYSYGHRDNWKSPKTWRGWAGSPSPAAGQIKIMGDIFRSISWWRLVPDLTIFTAPVDGSAAARSAEGEWMLAYLTTGAAVTIRMGVITAGREAAVSWIDPMTGGRTRIGIFPAYGTQSFIPPEGWEDAVLLLQKEN